MSHFTRVLVIVLVRVLVIVTHMHNFLENLILPAVDK